MVVLHSLREFAGLRSGKTLYFPDSASAILQKVQITESGCPWAPEILETTMFCPLLLPCTHTSAQHALLRNTLIVAFPLSTLARNPESKVILGLLFI